MILIKESGLLVACSQDRKVICWIYQKGEILDQFSKPDDIRCLEYVSESAQLLMGTDTDHGDINTHDIKEYINFFDSDLPRITHLEHY
jgi:hypothetical protein